MTTEIKFEVVEHIGTLSESSKGWTKELNLISWNGKEPKFDFRDWAPNKEKMEKWITLSSTGVENLRGILNK